MELVNLTTLPPVKKSNSEVINCSSVKNFDWFPTPRCYWNVIMSYVCSRLGINMCEMTSKTTGIHNHWNDS